MQTMHPGACVQLNITGSFLMCELSGLCKPCRMQTVVGKNSSINFWSPYSNLSCRVLMYEQHLF